MGTHSLSHIANCFRGLLKIGGLVVYAKLCFSFSLFRHAPFTETVMLLSFNLFWRSPMRLILLVLPIVMAAAPINAFTCQLQEARIQLASATLPTV